LTRKPANYLLLALGLAAVWFLLSGHTDPLLLGLGVVSVALTTALAWRMDVTDLESHPVLAGMRYVAFWPWLAWEIFKANIDVAKRILSPSAPISPTCFRLEASQKTVLGRVVYANAITLTPGTVTIDVSGSTFEVHALASETADDLQTGRMDRRVSKAEGQG
jgi:multicomponent Na+:H+ antiporter subunit E